MNKIAIHDGFLDSLLELPRPIQHKTKILLRKLQRNPNAPGLHLEKIQDTGNLYSVRIDQTYRGVLARSREQGSVVIPHVDSHDDAYAWARRHRAGVNPDSGIFEVMRSNPQPAAAAASREPAEAAGTPIGGLFEGLRDRNLRKLNISDDLIPLARSITDEDEFAAVADRFPLEAHTAVEMLLAGYTYQEALDELHTPATDVDADDIDAVLDFGSQGRLWVVDNEEELKRMLDAPQEKWRVFLHPSQRRLVDRDWNGPVRVLGGAGTGKTVVAMHRAKWLARHRAQQTDGKVLFLTFTANLAADLRRNLEDLVTHEEDLARVEVVHLDQWVYRFLNQHNFPQRIVYDHHDSGRQQAWDEALKAADPDLALEPEFYKEEWSKVVLAQGVLSRNEYLHAFRKGRGTPVTRPKRARIWQVFEAYRAHLAANGLIEKEDAYRAARHLVDANTGQLPYVSVIVDEAQDLGYEAFRLIASLARINPGGESMEQPGPNSLFIVGDPHQRIYDQQVVLGRCGINIRGRSSRLRVNYRTSREILHTAVSVLSDMPVDDLDGGTDTLAGYRSLFGGPEPKFLEMQNMEHGAALLQQWIANLQQEFDYGLQDICLVCRTNSQCDKWDEAIRDGNLPTHRIQTARDTRQTGAVQLATTHRVKGLEFPAVAILDAGPGNFPLMVAMNSAGSRADRELALHRERSLLHVAVSRAKRHLLVCTRTRFSPFLKPMLEAAGTRSDD